MGKLRIIVTIFWLAGSALLGIASGCDWHVRDNVGAPSNSPGGGEQERSEQPSSIARSVCPPAKGDEIPLGIGGGNYNLSI